MSQDRRDDWRNLVDERLVNLNSAVKVCSDQLDDLMLEQDKLDKMLRGNPEDRQEGLIEEIHALQTQVNKFNAILNPDHLGHGGLVNDIHGLIEKRKKSEAREGYFWHFATAVIVQCLVLIGLLVVNWDKIQEYITLHEHIYQATQIEKDTKRRKEKRKRHKVVAEANEGQEVSE